MLNRPVALDDRARLVRRALLGSALVAGSGLAAMLLRAPAPAVQPPTVVARPAPAPRVPAPAVELPPPPPPPPAPAPVEPPVIGTTCVADPSMIGTPITADDLGSTSLQGAAIDQDGCTIAAWTADELYASWDGGQTFGRFAANGHVDTVAVSAGRFAVIRDHNALGVLRAGDAALTWRSLGDLASTNPYVQPVLFAAGAWIAVARLTEVIGATDDDGVTWHTVTKPGMETVRVTADGQLWTTHTVNTAPDSSDGDPSDFVTQHYRTDVRTGRTREVPAIPKSPAWSYIQEPDKFWGCGGSEKIVAYHHGKPAGTIAGDLRPDVFSTDIVSNRTAAFALYNAQLHRLRGGSSIDLGPSPFDFGGHLIGVDRYGTPIAYSWHGVLRWSEQGGWRRLLWLPRAD